MARKLIKTSSSYFKYDNNIYIYFSFIFLNQFFFFFYLFLADIYFLVNGDIYPIITITKQDIVWLFHLDVVFDNNYNNTIVEGDKDMVS